MVILLTDMSPVFSKPARACSLRAVALGGPHQIFLDLARRRHRQGVHEADNRGRLEMRQLSLAIGRDVRGAERRPRRPNDPRAYGLAPPRVAPAADGGLGHVGVAVERSE